MRGQLALSKAFNILQLMATEGPYGAGAHGCPRPATLKLVELIQGIALPDSDSGSNQINAWVFKPGSNQAQECPCTSFVLSLS